MTSAPNGCYPGSADVAKWNADDWHLFLSRYLDSRANYPNGMATVALMIADSMEAMRGVAQPRLDPENIVTLTPEAYAKFIEICENPPEPTQALKDLFREFGRFAAPAQAVGMPWEPAETANVDFNAFYLVKDNGGEWRDFDLHIMRGQMVNHKLAPNYVRGRPEWIAKISAPSSVSSTEGK